MTVDPAKGMPGLGAEAFSDVLAAAQAGAGWAFERLYRALSPAVAGYLRIRGASDPEGLANEVFLHVFRGLDGFSGDEGGFRSWVFTIAHRRMIDDRRRLSVRPKTSEFDAELHETVGGDVEVEALSGVADDRIKEALAALTSDQRDVLIMRILGELTIEETAAALDKRPGAVKQLQRRGLEALRRALSSEGVTS